MLALGLSSTLQYEKNTIWGSILVRLRTTGMNLRNVEIVDILDVSTSIHLLASNFVGRYDCLEAISRVINEKTFQLRER
jgi:hypothetical protein